MEIRIWASSVFAEKFGFPDFYGRNVELAAFPVPEILVTLGTR